MTAKVINTKTSITAISINNKQYDVIERTVGSEKRFAELRKDDELTAIDVWVKSLEILIGIEAFNEIFPDLDNANATLLERVFVGAVEAYNSDYTADKKKRTAEKTNELKAVVAPLKDVAAVHKAVKDGEKQN